MWLRVAALLGGRSVDEWQAAMSSAEFMDWCAFYSLEPWGYEMENWRVGVVAATTANSAGRKKPLKPTDFMPKSGRKKRAKSAEEIESELLKVSTHG
jgi:hypothetical protein